MSLATEIPVIVGVTIRRDWIERPHGPQMLQMAADAMLNGFGLSGTGPIKRVTGSTITIIVGPTGCTCCTWRNGEFCMHAALWIAEAGTVELPPMTTTSPAYRSSLPLRFCPPHRAHQTVERIA